MKKDIGKEIRENILKYTPLLRNPLYKLNKAADHLENWVNGVLDLHPLLDVSGCLGFVYGNCRLCTKRCKRPMSFLGAFFLPFHAWPTFPWKLSGRPLSAQVCCGIPFSGRAHLRCCTCGRIVWGIREFVVEAWACTTLFLKIIVEVFWISFAEGFLSTITSNNLHCILPLIGRTKDLGCSRPAEGHCGLPAKGRTEGHVFHGCESLGSGRPVGGGAQDC